MASTRRNDCVRWDDGHDHSQEYAVIQRTDLSTILETIDSLMTEVTRLIVVESVVDAVDAAVQRARQGHGDLNEAVLSGIVKTYRRALSSE